MYEALTVLGREDESPLGNVTFESFVSALPLGVPYSLSITVGLDGTWGHDESGGSYELTQTQVHSPDVFRLTQFVTTLTPENVTRR